MFRCAPTDSKIQDLDETTKAWMYYSWAEDTHEEYIKLRNQACLIGSFWNAESAKKIMNDDENTIAVTDEDFEKATKYMLEQGQQKPKRKRKKKKVVFNQKDKWPL
ncbi:MAG TPA: hypothetical protein VMX17_05980 [Candidatus Glassbacteria bacterium]|nr:hypothetical protein [Candidatus Glassbacteria bacterium]